MLHYYYFVVLLRCHLLWLSLSLCMNLTYSYGLPNVDNTIGHNSQGNLLPHNDKAYTKTLTAPVVDETIDEVQKILHRDPTLPRLTKGEIQELYEKVTREELQEKFKKDDRKNRAEHVRALMLVLPFNTDNTTEQNLQELFTRPPVTKVVDTDTTHKPIQFVTPSNSQKHGIDNNTSDIGIIVATTYKPHYTLASQIVEPSSTTYHPKRKIIVKTTSNKNVELLQPFKPINIEKPQLTKTLQRFSSHYNAKNADFLLKEIPSKIQMKGQSTSSNVLDDVPIISDEYDLSESAPKPVYNSYFPQTVSTVTDSKGGDGQSLTAHIKPDAYMKFKPLNIGEEIRVKPEIEDYLTRFGIVKGRKRKDLQRNKHNGKNTDEQIEQVGLSSEKTIKKLPLNNIKGRKNATDSSTLSQLSKVPSNTELEKLLKNLRELEKLNIKPKINIKTTTIMPTSAASTIHYTSLVNNGMPKLIEAKKPRRRIDPNIDINFGNKSNKQTSLTSNDDQLAKLLQNLQELEKLQIDPQRVIKTMVMQTPQLLQNGVRNATPAPAPAPARTTTTTTTTRTTTISAPRITSEQNVINKRFNEQQNLQLKQQYQQQQQERQQLLLLHQQQAQKVPSERQPDLQQLQRLLLQLQSQEQPKIQTRITPKITTTTTTAATITLSPRPIISKKSTPQVPVVPNDLWQLRKLLTNDEELEKLFQQAKARQQLQQQNQLRSKYAPSTTTSTTTTTAAATSTTNRPSVDEHNYHQEEEQQQQQQQQRQLLPPSLNDLSQLQKYLAQIELQQQRQRLTTKETTTTTPKPTTTTTTTTSMPTTTTTTTTTPQPPSIILATTKTTATTRNTFANSLAPTAFDQYFTQNAKPNLNNDQLEALINRVQQLESLNNQQQLQTKLPQSQFVAPTVTPLTDILGFTTRNVKDPVMAVEKQFHALPINDFANLRTLYKQQLQNANDHGHGNSHNHGEKSQVEISTAATTVKIQKHIPNQEVTAASSDNTVQQQIIDVTNDTRSSNSLTQVDPREFIQLQKLLSKVQELERVRINIPTATVAATTKATHEVEALKLFEPFELYRKVNEADNNLLTVKTVAAAPLATASSKFNQSHLQKPSNLHVVYAAKDTTASATTGSDNEIPKTTTVETLRKTANVGTSEELEKLLSNAKELKKLGIKLPELKDMNVNMGVKTLTTTTTTTTTTTMTTTTEGQKTKTKTLATADQSIMNTNPRDKAVVFSLTTVKSVHPRPTRPSATTTESAVQLPVFSATKIIEDAIIRAANKIGVSTELPDAIDKEQERKEKGKEAQTKSNVEDLLASFSEIDSTIIKAPDNLYANISLVKDDTKAKTMIEREPEEQEKKKLIHLQENLPELNRLIKNLHELQQLNLSSNSALLRRADYQYLQNLKKQQQQQQQKLNITKQQQHEKEGVTKKIRRQSVTTEITTTTATTATTANDANPTRVQLDLSLSQNENNFNDDNLPTNSTTEEETTIAATTSTSTTTEESRNANLSDLEASFGLDPNRQEPLPTPPQKKNGFYFMADWNSFLEVGDGDDQVIVRFSPKIGDPSAFIPVKIP